MSNVIHLTPSLTTPQDRMYAARQAFMKAWTTWASTNPAAVDVDEQIEFTVTALRQLAELMRGDGA
jgi:hypothetical protein